MGVIDRALVRHHRQAERAESSRGDGDFRGPALGRDEARGVTPAPQPLAASGTHVEHRPRPDGRVVRDSFERPRRRLEDKTVAEHGEARPTGSARLFRGWPP